MRVARFARHENGRSAFGDSRRGRERRGRQRLVELVADPLAARVMTPPGVDCALDDGAAARARDPAVEGHRRRQELRRSRRRDAQRDRRRRARRAAALPQAEHRGDRSERVDRAAADLGARGVRGRARDRHRRHGEERLRGRRPCLRLRLHLRQRRHGPRPADLGRPVGPREGLRHLLPARPRHRDRP